MELQVLDYELSDGESIRLEPAVRVVYRVAEEQGAYSSDAVTLEGPGRVLAFELVETASPEAMLSATLDLEPGDGRLIRLDRVRFPPGGVAYLHVHQGPGIRVLLDGEIRIETDGLARRYRPMEAWFEPGPVPVFAAASPTAPTTFVRCMVLPAALEGKRSIRYVRPEDADKPKGQQYTVFLEQALTADSVAT